jgi:hypothetical protein
VKSTAFRACFNSGQRVEDHFVGIDEMVEIGSGAQRATMPEELPTVESIKRLEAKAKKALKKPMP